MNDRFAAPSFSTAPPVFPLQERFPVVWCFRILPALAVLSLVLAQTVFRTGNLHDFLIGFPTGLLAVLMVLTFTLEKVSFRSRKQSSDVQIERITP